MEPVLSLDHVTKRFGKQLAVNDVSFSVSPGSAVGLIGPNGSGKSTLIKCCVGILRPDKGRITVAGHVITSRDIEAKRYLAYAPEIPQTVWKFTPWDHFAFLASVLEIEGWEPEAERLLRAFDLWEKRDKLTGEFSKGEDQKVMLSMAFLRRPHVLFLDEPLIGLDPRAAMTLKREVSAHLARGGAAVICSHSLPLVEEVCGVLAVLSRGRLGFIGTADGLRVAARESPGTPLEEAFVKVTQPGEGEKAE